MPSLVHSRNKITIRQQQPSTGPNWIHFKLVRSVFFAAVVRLECSTRNMHQITHAYSFSQFLFYSKIKRQKDAISPNGLSCAHAQGCHVTHLSGRRTTALKLAPNFTSSCGIGWYSYRPFLSSENVIHLYLHIFTIHLCILYWFFHVCD